MSEQTHEVNLQYAYNSLMDRFMEVVKENSYKDSIIAVLQEELNESKAADTEDAEDAE